MENLQIITNTSLDIIYSLLDVRNIKYQPYCNRSHKDIFQQNSLVFKEYKSNVLEYLNFLQNQYSYVLFIDTKICLRAKIIDFINDEQTAGKLIADLSGRRHRIITSIGVIKQNQVKLQIISSIVAIKRLTMQEQEQYLIKKLWQNKIGGYIDQESFIPLIKFINGSPNHIKGLPLYELNNVINNLANIQ